jgi:hypothetical protein
VHHVAKRSFSSTPTDCSSFYLILRLEHSETALSVSKYFWKGLQLNFKHNPFFCAKTWTKFDAADDTGSRFLFVENDRGTRFVFDDDRKPLVEQFAPAEFRRSFYVQVCQDVGGVGVQSAKPERGGIVAVFRAAKRLHDTFSLFRLVELPGDPDVVCEAVGS